MLSPWNVDSLGDADVTKHTSSLLENLSLVDLDAQVVDCCVRASLPTLAATRKVMLQISKKVRDAETALYCGVTN